MIRPHHSSWSRPHYHNGRFYNAPGERLNGFMMRSLLMYMQSWCKRQWTVAPQANSWQITSSTSAPDIPHVTWIGHASFLLTLKHCTVLTDPLFGNPSWLFRRILPPGITFAQLPAIDYVLISHNHRDHMDAASLFALRDMHNATFLVPLGLKSWFDQRGFKKVYEYSWWQMHEAPEVRFHFLPAYHWSQRGLWDRNRTLWGSWLLEDDQQRIYFGGDTGYANHFTCIAQRFPAIEYALLPIGPCEPRAWMRHCHLSAEEAGQAFVDLGARTLIPMHWGTFYFGTDRFSDPIHRLERWWHQQTAMPGHKELLRAHVGQQISLTPTLLAPTPLHITRDTTP